MKKPFAERCRQLGIDERDLVETFARSSGPGGQHVNKVSTAVTLTHPPSGLAVTVQDSRSQSANRELARERLLARFEENQRAVRAQRRADAEKARRQKRPRPRSLKRKLLEGKRRRGEVKKLRGKPDE